MAIWQDGETALMEGQLHVVKLVEKEADIMTRDKNNGMAALILAACGRGHPETVKLLMEKGGDDTDVGSMEGDTALILAAHGGHDETVSFLLDQDVELDV